MLVLSRKIGEAVVLGETVKVFVLGIDRNQVRLGFEAPQVVSIYREEVHQRMQKEKRSA